MVYSMFNVRCNTKRKEIVFLNRKSLFRLEQMDKTNDKLDQVNKFSTKRYADAQRDFVSHTQLLTTMKNDLDLIFKRIKYEIHFLIQSPSNTISDY